VPTCEAGTRYIELTAEVPSKPSELCIRPELSINLFFNAKLLRVLLPHLREQRGGGGRGPLRNLERPPRCQLKAR